MLRMLNVMRKYMAYALRRAILDMLPYAPVRWLLTSSEARPVVSKAQTLDDFLYQFDPGFVSKMEVGCTAPDGAAYTLDGKATTLYATIDPARLTILNFGSCSWPPFVKGLKQVGDIAKTNEAKGVDHVVVYMIEAHPTDGWMSEVSQYEGITYAKAIEDRLATARMFAQDTTLRKDATTTSSESLVGAKVIVDNMEDTLERSYEARPERLYVVKGGKVLWRSGIGPFEYDVDGLEAFIKTC